VNVCKPLAIGRLCLRKIRQNIAFSLVAKVGRCRLTL